MKNTFDFDFVNGEFIMEKGKAVVLTGRDALRLWAEKAIRTQIDRYEMYIGKKYGAYIEDLVIGKSYNFDFVESELKREIETALLRHEDILTVTSFSAERSGTALNITFTLKTIYGNITEEYAYDI